MNAFDAGSAWLSEFRLATPGETGRVQPATHASVASSAAFAPDRVPWGLLETQQAHSQRRRWPWVRPETAHAGRHSIPSQRVRAFLATFDHRAALWGSLGFIAGMVVWHFVGFWWFVAGVVLNSGPGPEISRETSREIAREIARETSRETTHIAAAPTARAEADQASRAPTATMTTGSIATFHAAAEYCVALVIDRAAGQTVPAPCTADTGPMRDAGRRRRGDRAPPAAAADLPLQHDPMASAAITEKDFNLDLSPRP